MARRAAAFLLLAGSLVSPVLAAALTPPSLDAARLSSPSGASQTILHIAETGRYSVTAQSPTGASFEIIDRMAGRIASATPPQGVSVSTGRVSRVDAYLEPGEYKVRATHPGTETVALQVRKFEVVNTDPGAGPGPAAAPVLADGQTARDELGDLQLFQYWVTLDAEHSTLLLEAWGRGLKDVAVWKDGVWDTGLRAEGTTIELEPGRPLTVLEINARLEPGSYLVTCAGGSLTPWAKDSTAQPFFITRGGRFLGEMGRMSLTLPAQGTTSFLVSGTVSMVEMQVHRANAYRLFFSANQGGRSRYADARQAGIDVKSTSLRCRVTGATGAETSWVTVQGPAGETVEIAWLGQPAGGVLRPFPETASYLTSVLSSLEGESSMDATGLVVQASRDRGKDVLDAKAIQAVTLSPDRPLRRQVNCLGEISFILQPQRGTYAVVEKDRAAASARYRFQLLDDVLLGGGAPVVVSSGGRITLVDKLYAVTISPVKAGILDFAIVPTSFLGRARTGDVFSSPPPAPQADFSWPSTSVTQTASASTYLILPPRREVVQGFVARKLPVDLSQPLPLLAGAGQTITFAFTLSKEAALASTSGAFSASSVTVDGEAWAPGRPYSAGPHTCVIRNPASLAQWHVISAIQPERPAQPLPRTASIESLPALPEGRPAWQDLDPSRATAFLLKVPAPGSYRISTLGRLAMGIAVRTPLRQAFAEASENVDGRNAEIMAWLRPGTYMVQAAARGSSTGRAGILLQRMPVVQAGAVRDGEVLRATVPEGQVMQADVQVSAEGDYALECMGLGRAFPYRLEDSEGWPIGEPIRQGVALERMAAGTYHYLSMATRERTRRILSLRAAELPSAFDPNGKRTVLSLNQAVQKTWNESAGRAPDVFAINLPAEVRASLSLSSGMLFRLVDARGAVPYQGIGGKTLPVTLRAGEWKLEVTSLLEDSQKRYEVSLSTGDLLAGTAQPVSAAEAVLPVSVGAAGTVEIWSYGGYELDASLTDETGRLIAQGQAIPDDWNFRVMAQVAPGRYLLHISSPVAPAPVPAAAQPARPPAMEEEPSGDEGSGDYESGEEGEYSPGDEDSGDYQPDEEADYQPDDQSVDESAADEEAGEEAGEPVPSTPHPVIASQPLGGASLVRLVVRDEKPLSPAAGTLDTSVELGPEIAVVPFSTKEAAVYRLAGQSIVPLTVAVFRDDRLLASGPSPLRIVLAPQSRYTLRFWSSSSRKAAANLRAGPERSMDASADGTVDVSAPSLRLAFPAGTSYRLEAEGPLWYAPGPESPFQPLEEAAVSSAGGSGWAVRPDGSPIGTCRVSTLSLSDGITQAVMIGDEEGSFLVRVPSRTAALVRTENMGRAVGLSASSAPRPAQGFDWSGALVDSSQSLLGLREGAFRGRLWSTEPAPAAVDHRIRVSARMFPVASDAALRKGGEELTVAGGTAAARALPAGQRTVEVSLERGMVAFAWAAGPGGMVDASAAPATGLLDAAGGSVVVLNLQPTAGLCTLREAAPAGAVEVAEGAPWESSRPAAAELSLDVRGARSPSRLYLYGALDQARLYSQEDGRVYEGQPLGSALGTLLVLPAHRGRLVVRPASGPVRAWIASPDQVVSAFVGRDPRARQAALPPEGGALQPFAQAWTVSLDADSIVSLRAEGGGIVAVFNQPGVCLGAGASAGDRSLVTLLPRGAYTVYTRPFVDAGAPGGTLVFRLLSPRSLEADGVGPDALIGSRDSALYRFTVTARGKVGCGIRARSETLTATLLDARFERLDSGRIFVRTLPPGVYYLLVEANGVAQSYAPVVYGLQGNAAHIPDDVLSSYQGE